MNSFFTIAFIIINLFLLSSCSSVKELDIGQKKDIPMWYLNPPSSSDKILYSTGEGQSRQDAIANALSMMASTLSVSVASQFSSKKLVEEGVVNTHQRTTLHEVQSDVKKIRIASYELVESHQLGFQRHIVLIKSYKEKLLSSIKNELNQRFSIIDKKIESISLYNAIEQLGIYKKIKEETNEMQNILIIAHVLDSTFNTKEYIEKIKIIDSAYTLLRLSITISIDSDYESKNLQAPIREALNLKKLQIKNANGANHFNIVIKSNIQKASSYGFMLARSAIEITIKDYKNTIIGSNKLNIIGQSTQGYEIAKENIAIKLGEMIKKDGIEKIIGIEF